MSGTAWRPPSVLFPHACACRRGGGQSSAHNTSSVVLILRDALGRSSLSRDSRAVREIRTPFESEESSRLLTTSGISAAQSVCVKHLWATVELRLSGLIGTASHPDVQEVRIIGFFLKNVLHRQFEVRLLLFTVCTCVWTFRPRLIWSSRSHNTVLYLIR
jgi:hypothetical protein